MLEKGDVHFALGSLGKYDIFIGTQFSWFLQKQPKMKNLKNLILIKTADNIPQACCPRVEVVQCVIMFHEDHQTLENVVENVISKFFSSSTSIAFQGSSSLYPV